MRWKVCLKRVRHDGMHIAHAVVEPNTIASDTAAQAVLGLQCFAAQHHLQDSLLCLRCQNQPNLHLLIGLAVNPGCAAPFYVLL